MKNQDSNFNQKIEIRLKIVKTTRKTKYTNDVIGNDLKRRMLVSIIRGYRLGIYTIPALDGLNGPEAVKEINNWGICPISYDTWASCSRKERQRYMLSYEFVRPLLEYLGGDIQPGCKLLREMHYETMNKRTNP